MSIQHEEKKTEIVINENKIITIKPMWEESYSWEVITLTENKQQKEIGAYYTDGIAGLRQWFEYNDKSIVIFGEDKYTGTVYIEKAYDIQTGEFVTGSQNDLAEYYISTFKENAKTKNLTCRKKL